MDAATVVSTKRFEADVEGLLTADELAALEFSLATNPMAHPVIPGTDGVRKARWNRTGMGKRGGLRVIYYFLITAEVVYMLAAYSKNEKENLSNADKKALRNVVETLQQTVRPRK